MFQYRCGRCGKAVEKSAQTCPHCGEKLGNIHCKSCGFAGRETDFVNDRCPQCDASVRTSPVRYERCKECGRKIEAGQWTCPNCGNTQWGIILGLGAFALACIIVAIVFLPLPTIWTLLVGGVGVVLFFSAFYGIGGALRWRGSTTFLMTSLMLIIFSTTSLAARYRFTPGQSILQTPDAVVAAAALTETPVPTQILLPTHTPAPTATPQKTGVITAELANLRSQPDLQSQLLGTVAKDETVVILGRNDTGGWLQVTTQAGTTAWVYSPLIQLPFDRMSLPVVK
jgi:hypothetical protein